MNRMDSSGIASAEGREEPPDVMTASDAYRSRFSGAIGEHLLRVQAKTVMALVSRAGQGKRLMEVGGAHAQLTSYFLEAGYEVWVQGSEGTSFARLEELQARYPDRLHLVRSSLLQLPFENKYFDYVVAVRLLAHVEHWKELLTEMCRVSRHAVVFDFPPSLSFNIMYRFFFLLKQRMEGAATTRTFLRFSTRSLSQCLERAGFRIKRVRRQFFLPMAFHRKLRCVPLSRAIEGACAALGLTHFFGSPAVLLAEEMLQHML